MASTQPVGTRANRAYGGLNMGRQKHLFDLILSSLEEYGELTNQVLQVTLLLNKTVELGRYPVQPSGRLLLERQEGIHVDGEAIITPISRREMRVLAMLARGQTNAEIANDLRVSSRTVKRTLSNIYERLRDATTLL